MIDRIAQLLDEITDFEFLGIPGIYFFYFLTGIFLISQFLLIVVVMRRNGKSGEPNREGIFTYHRIFNILTALGTYLSGALSALTASRPMISSYALLQPAKIGAIFILIVAGACIWLAANRTPRKMLIAVGSAFAFVLAAFAFEALLMLISFVESAPT